MRKVESSDLVGKTIKAIDNSASNCLTLSFTDGTTLELFTEIVVATIRGDIHGIFVSDNLLPNE